MLSLDRFKNKTTTTKRHFTKSRHTAQWVEHRLDFSPHSYSFYQPCCHVSKQQYWERREMRSPWYTKKESVGPIKGAIQGLKPSLWMAVELNEGVRKPPVPSPSLGFQGSDSLFCYNVSSSTLHCPFHIDRVMTDVNLLFLCITKTPNSKSLLVNSQKLAGDVMHRFTNSPFAPGTLWWYHALPLLP